MSADEATKKRTTIKADADIESLKRDYALVIERGKTLLTVDDKPQWVQVTKFTAICCGKLLMHTSEHLDGKMTPEVQAEKEAFIIEALKLKILETEEGEQSHG